LVTTVFRLPQMTSVEFFQLLLAFKVDIKELVYSLDREILKSKWIPELSARNKIKSMVAHTEVIAPV